MNLRHIRPLREPLSTHRQPPAVADETLRTGDVDIRRDRPRLRQRPVRQAHTRTG